MSLGSACVEAIDSVPPPCVIKCNICPWKNSTFANLAAIMEQKIMAKSIEQPHLTYKVDGEQSLTIKLCISKRYAAKAGAEATTESLSVALT